MGALIVVLVIVAVLGLLLVAMAIRIVKQYERGVLFRSGGCGESVHQDYG